MLLRKFTAPSLYNIIIVNNSEKKTRSLVLCWASAQVSQTLFPWVGCDGGDLSAAVVLSLCSYLSFSAFVWFPLICCWLLTLYSFALLMTSTYMCSVPYIFLFAGERRMIIMKRKNISNKEGRYPFYVFEHVQLLSHVWRSATLWSVTCQSPVSGTSQARLLEWADASCSWGSSWPRDWTYISCICRWVFFFFKPLSHQGSPNLFIPSCLLTCEGSDFCVKTQLISHTLENWEELGLTSRDIGMNSGFATFVISANYLPSLSVCLTVYKMSLKMALNKDIQFSSVAQSCQTTLPNPMDCSRKPGFPVHRQLPKIAQTHVHRVGDAIQLSHPLSSPSPPAFNLSHHQGLFQWLSSLHQVAKVLELQLYVSPSGEYSGLISFMIDRFHLLAVQGTLNSLLQFSSVQSLSRARLFVTPWITACQASLSITNSRSLLKLMSIESVMPSSHLILCHPLLLLPPIPPSIRVFSSESTLWKRWPKYWSVSFNISPSNEHPGLPPLGWTGWISLQSKGLSRVFSNTTVQKHQFFSTQLSL